MSLENLVVWFFLLALPATVLFVIAISRRSSRRADPMRPPLDIDERPKNPFRKTG